MSFCIWLTSFDTMFSRCIHIVAHIRTSFFLLPYNILLYKWCFVYPFICCKTLGCFYLLAIANNGANSGMRVSVQVSAFDSFGSILGAEFLSHAVILCLCFSVVSAENRTQGPPHANQTTGTAAVPLHIPTSNTQGFQFLTSSLNIYFLCLKIIIMVWSGMSLI